MQCGWRGRLISLIRMRRMAKLLWSFPSKDTRAKWWKKRKNRLTEWIRIVCKKSRLEGRERSLSALLCAVEKVRGTNTVKQQDLQEERTSGSKTSERTDERVSRMLSKCQQFVQEQCKTGWRHGLGELRYRKRWTWGKTYNADEHSCRHDRKPCECIGGT